MTSLRLAGSARREQNLTKTIEHLDLAALVAALAGHGRRLLEVVNRQLIGDPDSSFPLSIRTSEPIPQWKATNVSLIGDAIHTMTPGRGVGANTALRDARLLTRTLTKAARGEVSLLEAVHEADACGRLPLLYVSIELLMVTCSY
ncbi:MAG: FAD-dependent oxidoreductase [Streptosporangiaceae bacterium]